MSGPPEIALFFGRLHPLLVHLPIGLIVLLTVLEVLARVPRFKQANSNAGVILALTVPAALFTVLCGWLLSLGGGYQDQLLQWHKWTGIGTASACLLAGLLYRLELKKLYRACLFCTFLALLVASHFGGSLTHGSDYLTRYAPGPLKKLLGGASQSPATTPASTAKLRDFAQLEAFADVIRPELQQRCVSCHGPEKLKGKLRLDSLTSLMAGGGSGPAVVPGKSADSELIRRLKLPLTDDDHMPPGGKPQPGAEEITLLQWWIDAGAPADKKVTELKPPANIRRILQARFGAPEPIVKKLPVRPLAEVLPLASKLSAQLNVSLAALSPKEPWLQCNASIAGTNFGDAELAQLAPVGPNLRWLDLAGTGVSDSGLAQLASMPNLIRLHLERTAITDHGLAAVGEVSGLEYLDLYGTAITDEGLKSLQDLPSLKQVYVWNTRVTAPAAAEFIEAKTDRDQLQHWKDEIEQLKAKISGARISVELGTTAGTQSTNTSPINANCPVSGKPVDLTKTVVHEGALVAFCCDDCKAKFQNDPKPFLEKLGLLMPKNSKSKP